MLETFRADDAKQRSLRISLERAPRPHWLARWKVWLTAFAALPAIAYGVWVTTTFAGGEHLSPGPVAGPHQVWDRDCRACHVPGAPLRSDAAGTAWVHVALTTLTGGTPLNNTHLCVDCHKAQAADHHANQIASEVQSCADCHRDHQGAGAELRRPPDNVCTRCHADIAAHRLSEPASELTFEM